MMRIDLQPIMVPSPSVNDWHKRHWQYYSGIKQKWFKRICDAVLMTRGLNFWQQWERVKLEIHRIGPQPLDPDNLVAGMKPIIDVLCSGNSKMSTGIILDDDPEHLELVVTQSRSNDKQPPCTLIAITRLDDE